MERYAFHPGGDGQDLRDTLLANRGVEPSEQEAFLSPLWEDHHDPFLMHQMTEVVTRLWRACEQGERVVVYSDYDADGVPGAVILTDFCKKIGFANYQVYIPNRNTEGFGLNRTACESLLAQGVDLVITIDCGVSDLEEIRFLQENGVEVIVTDHHLPSGELGDCLVLNPKQEACLYPYKDLCGSGVVFKLVQALLAFARDSAQAGGFPARTVEGIPLGWEKWLLDMVAIATICDMVPLRGENRILVHYGLQVMRKSRRPGLRRLMELGRLAQPHLSAQDVAFVLGPRINAASRLADPLIAFRALSEEGQEALQAAQELEKLNRRRKTVVATAARAAYKKIKEMPPGPVIVVGDTQWPLGIVGLLAGKIAERYEKPVFVWTRVGERYRGSARSGGGLGVHRLMKGAREAFESFGGHEAAGGFICHSEQIHALQESLNTSSETCPPGESDKPVIEAQLRLEDVSWATWETLEALEPYGLENREPLFLLDQVLLSGVHTFGAKGQHLALSLSSPEGGVVRAVRFNYLDLVEILPEKGAVMSLVVSFELNRYGGRRELRLRIEDMVYNGEV